MAIYQIFVKLLDGKTRCLQISTPRISAETLKLNLLAITGIPPESQRLAAGSRQIVDGTLISADADGLFPSCSLLLRLPGGKGGFGSLLRGAATKAGQKKTNNFDACRDMSGRRIRHVNAEKKLEEWRAEAGDRKLEKLAEQFLKKKAKEVKKNSSADVEKYLEKYREDSTKCMEEVEESVRQSFKLYKDSKRKRAPTSEPSKRLKIWMGKKKMDESESDGDDDSDDDDSDDDGSDDDGSDGGDDKSVVIDDRNCAFQNKEDERTSALVSVFGTHSDGESSGGGSGQSNLEEIDGNSDMRSSPVEQESEIGMADEAVAQETAIPSSKELVDSDESKFVEGGCIQMVVVPSVEDIQGSVEPELAMKISIEPELVNKEPFVQSTSASDIDKPLNFDVYNSAKELEVFGMERLKAELQVRGLKCGGTLQERAARLFLLKTTPLEKLPKKLLAKPAAGGGKL